MNITLELDHAEFWMLRTTLVRQIEEYRGYLASSERWSSPCLKLFQEGLEGRQRLLARLDAAHPHGAAQVARYAA